MSLPLKYRPQTFDEVLGSKNKSMIASLKTVLEKESKPKTILLQGPSGCGKTTTARIIAGEFGARDIDIKELNISNTRGIDAARAIIDNVRHKSLGGKCKVIILDECHLATKEFQNTMLKTLEEPPPNTYFILCTTEPEKLLPTIKTRATTYQVSPLMNNEVLKLLKVVCKKEGKKVDEKVLQEIVRVAEGCPREALTVLDAVIDMDNTGDQIQAIIDQTVSESSLKELCIALLNSKSWKVTSEILKNLEGEPESIRYGILGYMNSVLLNSGNIRASDIIIIFENNFYDSKKAGLNNACFMVSK